MKQIFTSLFVVAILSVSTSVMAEERKEIDPKVKTETVKTEEETCSQSTESACEKDEKKECCEKEEKTSEKKTGSENKSCGKK
jgi:hypothetical protein